MTVEDIQGLCSKVMMISETAINDSKHSTESSVEILDDDSLIEIFYCLSIAERIKIERVCKRWQNISKQSWTKLKILDMDSKFLGLKSFGTSNQYPKINNDVVEEVLRRCGRYLKEVVIKLDDLGCQLSKVAEYCQNTVRIIICKKASIKGIEKLTERCKHISVLHVEYYLIRPFVDELVNSLRVKKQYRVYCPKEFHKRNSLSWSLDRIISFNVQPIDIYIFDKVNPLKINYNKNIDFECSINYIIITALLKIIT